MLFIYLLVNYCFPHQNRNALCRKVSPLCRSVLPLLYTVGFFIRKHRSGYVSYHSGKKVTQLLLHDLSIAFHLFPSPLGEAFVILLFILVHELVCRAHCKADICLAFGITVTESKADRLRARLV